MRLQQLKTALLIAQNDLSVSRAARQLASSQPALSKQLRLLEDDLGFTIFERSGKRLTGITEPGQQIIALAKSIVLQTNNLATYATEYIGGDCGKLVIATSHTQARYGLPQPIGQFVAAYPNVQLELRQGNPEQLAEWAAVGIAHVAAATESLAEHPDLITFPWYQWRHIIIVPKKHPLTDEARITIHKLAQYPIITYDQGIAGRSHISQSFTQQGIMPNIVLSALDADVIKTYVRLGLGVGIISEVAFEALRDQDLVRIRVDNLFESNTARLAVKRGRMLRKFEYAFLVMAIPHINPLAIEKALSDDSSDFSV